MRGWKDFYVRLTYTNGTEPRIVKIRATHTSMALFVAKRDNANVQTAEIVD